MIPQKEMLGLIMSSSHLIFLIRAVYHSRIPFFAEKLAIAKSGEADGEIMIAEKSR
jgi:hypothetical protein